MKSNISIFKPSRSPFWYIQWYDEDGNKRQKSTGSKDKRDALKSLTDLKTFTKDKKPKPTLFSQFAQHFKESCAGTLSSGTLEIYRQAFNNFERLAGDIHLHSITPRQWDMFRAERLKEVRPTTCNIELRALRAALSTAVRWQLIEKNPFSCQPMCRIIEEDAPFLTLEQLRSILFVMKNPDMRDFITIAFFTGMRRGEILSLQWTYIDFSSGVLFVRNNASFHTKTGKQRAIPMNVEVADILSRRRQDRTSEHKMIFPDVSENLPTKIFKTAAKQVFGKDTKIHFHSLRHSFCSNLVRAGVNIRVVQSLAGHSSIATTEKYLHNVTTDARNAVELLSMN